MHGEALLFFQKFKNKKICIDRLIIEGNIENIEIYQQKEGSSIEDGSAKLHLLRPSVPHRILHHNRKVEYLRNDQITRKEEEYGIGVIAGHFPHDIRRQNRYQRRPRPRNQRSILPLLGIGQLRRITPHDRRQPRPTRHHKPTHRHQQQPRLLHPIRNPHHHIDPTQQESRNDQHRPPMASPHQEDPQQSSRQLDGVDDDRRAIGEVTAEFPHDLPRVDHDVGRPAELPQQRQMQRRPFLALIHAQLPRIHGFPLQSSHLLPYLRSPNNHHLTPIQQPQSRLKLLPPLTLPHQLRETLRHKPNYQPTLQHRQHCRPKEDNHVLSLILAVPRHLGYRVAQQNPQDTTAGIYRPALLTHPGGKELLYVPRCHRRVDRVKDTKKETAEHQGFQQRSHRHAALHQSTRHQPVVALPPRGQPGEERHQQTPQHPSQRQDPVEQTQHRLLRKGYTVVLHQHRQRGRGNQRQSEPRVHRGDAYDAAVPVGPGLMQHGDLQRGNLRLGIGLAFVHVLLEGYQLN